MMHSLQRGLLMFYKAIESKCMQALKAPRPLNKVCDAIQGSIRGKRQVPLVVHECTETPTHAGKVSEMLLYFSLLWICGCIWQRNKMCDSLCLEGIMNKCITTIIFINMNEEDCKNSATAIQIDAYVSLFIAVNSKSTIL